MKKINNQDKVLNNIIVSKGIARADISRKLGLNKATVSYLISELEEKTLIVQKDELKITKGRHSVIYELNRNYGTIISINLKPSRIQYYITNLYGTVIFSNELKKIIHNPDELFNCICDIINELFPKYNNIIAIGIGIHGTIYSNGIIHFAPYNNISNYNLKQKLYDKFSDTHIFIENEANITALGENHILDEENLITITNSKGVGCGIIINYKIYKGQNGFAGEIGHTIVKPNGLECACGNKGCLEQYSSEENILSKASTIKNTTIDRHMFLQLFNNNDEDIKKIYYTSLNYLCIAINNMICMLNPSKIILNGFLYINIDDTIPYIQSKIHTKVQSNHNIVISKINDQAFCYGFAHSIVREIFLK